MIKEGHTYKLRRFLAAWVLVLSIVFATGCLEPDVVKTAAQAPTVDEAPAYSGDSYVEINGNEPDFTEEEITDEAYEAYSKLDEYGRCGTAQACVGEELMPTEKRGKIGQVKPSGWKTAKYDNVEGKYLYNRCHLIAYQLTAENANEENLITGTRYMNTEMIPFENEVADYVKETGNHVMYRATPVFEGDNLVASGLQLEAESVEDNGRGVSFNIYFYNIQPGIQIDYSDGTSREGSETPEEAAGRTEENNAPGDSEATYIINRNTHKFHREDCSGVSDIKSRNKEEFTGGRKELIERGYEPCGRCKP